MNFNYLDTNYVQFIQDICLTNKAMRAMYDLEPTESDIALEAAFGALPDGEVMRTIAAPSAPAPRKTEEPLHAVIPDTTVADSPSPPQQDIVPPAIEQVPQNAIELAEPSFVEAACPVTNETELLTALYDEYWNSLGDDRYAHGLFDRFFEQYLLKARHAQDSSAPAGGPCVYRDTAVCYNACALQALVRSPDFLDKSIEDGISKVLPWLGQTPNFTCERSSQSSGPVAQRGGPSSDPFERGFYVESASNSSPPGAPPNSEASASEPSRKFPAVLFDITNRKRPESVSLLDTNARKHTATAEIATLFHPLPGSSTFDIGSDRRRTTLTIQLASQDSAEDCEETSRVIKRRKTCQ